MDFLWCRHPPVIGHAECTIIRASDEFADGTVLSRIVRLDEDEGPRRFHATRTGFKGVDACALDVQFDQLRRRSFSIAQKVCVQTSSRNLNASARTLASRCGFLEDRRCRVMKSQKKLCGPDTVRERLLLEYNICGVVKAQESLSARTGRRVWFEGIYNAVRYPPGKIHRIYTNVRAPRRVSTWLRHLEA